MLFITTLTSSTYNFLSFFKDLIAIINYTKERFKMKRIDEQTNSYFSKDEMDILKNIGFSWSNASNNCAYGYDNHLYRQDSIQQNLNVEAKIISAENGEKEIEVIYKIKKYVPTLFGVKTISSKYEDFESLIKETEKVYFSNYLYIFNSFFFLILYTIFRILLAPFLIKNKEGMKEYCLHVKNLYKFKYYFLNDALPFVWGMNLFVIGILTAMYFSMS